MVDKPTDKRFIDLEGHKYGRLLVVSYAGKKGEHHYWWVECDCGTEKQVGGRHLRNGKTVSCGCIKDDQNHFRGKRHTEEAKAKNRAAHIGKPWNAKPEYIENRRRRFTGKTNPNYVDGKSRERSLRFWDSAHRKWRKSVFERDDYTCQRCFSRGVYLHAHHIKPYSTHPEMRLDVDNGMTLCPECHRQVHREMKEAA